MNDVAALVRSVPSPFDSSVSGSSGFCVSESVVVAYYGALCSVLRAAMGGAGGSIGLVRSGGMCEVVGAECTGAGGGAGSVGDFVVRGVGSGVDDLGGCEQTERRAGGAACHGERIGNVDESLNASVRGKHYLRNRKRKQLRRCKVKSASGVDVVPVWRESASPVGSCETVLSCDDRGRVGCPSYGQALSDAEREAKQTLASRRAAENKLNEKLALMKLASLEDEKKCQEYADLKKSRIIQWTNEAVAKSQQSLDKCKTIDPASSSSQADIRAQAKELADVKAHFDQFARRVAEFVPNCGELLNSCKAPGTATMDFLVAQAACSSNAGSIDPLDITDDMDVKVQGYVRARGYKAERFPVLTDEVMF